MAERSTVNDLVSKAKPYIGEIEEIEAEMERLQSEHMARLKGKRAQRKDVYAAAKDAGVPTRPLKGVVKQRTLQRKIEKIPADFDLDESAAYRELAAGALGDLGVAAAERAGYGNGNGEDVRPGFMQRSEHERADVTHLDAVGRGNRRRKSDDDKPPAV